MMFDIIPLPLSGRNPGEDPASVKAPEVVADRLVALIAGDFENGHFERID